MIVLCFDNTVIQTLFLNLLNSATNKFGTNCISLEIVVSSTWCIGIQKLMKTLNSFYQLINIFSWFETFCFNQFVGNKAKEWISKRVFQENKARQIFRKTKNSYPLTRTRTCAHQGIRNVCFSENLTCLPPFLYNFLKKNVSFVIFY